RCFSLESTALVSMTLGTMGSSFSSFRVSASLYVVEIVMPRVLMMSCMVYSEGADDELHGCLPTARPAAPYRTRRGALPPFHTTPKTQRRKSRRSEWNTNRSPLMSRRTRFSDRPLSLLLLEPPLVGRQDAELLAVLRDRPPRDCQPSFVQFLGDLLIGPRRRRAFRLHHVPDHLLDGDG